jgi:hypothetical protein
VGERDEEISDINVRALESAATTLLEAGLVGSKFERSAQELDQWLAQTESTPFEMGLQRLGSLLGWKSVRPAGAGPDDVWTLGDELCLVFEAKTDETPSGPISKATLLQAAGHSVWAKANVPLRQGARIAVIIVSPRQQLDKEAAVHAQDLHCLLPAAIRELGQITIGALRQVRSTSAETEVLTLHWHLHEVFQKEKLFPDDVISRLVAQKVSDLPVT